MKILGWNCRGICNTSTINALRALIRVHNSDVIFLSETKAMESHMNRVASLLHFPYFCCVEACGRSGGICLLWSHSIKVEVLEFDPNLIAINILDCICSWTLVGFYGPPHKRHRSSAWENLIVLLESVEGPWLCLGDFNVILEDAEKEGGRIGSSSLPNYLKDLMFELGAVDLCFAGNMM
jgi:exonuclease III